MMVQLEKNGDFEHLRKFVRSLDPKFSRRTSQCVDIWLQKLFTACTETTIVPNPWLVIVRDLVDARYDIYTVVNHAANAGCYQLVEQLVEQLVRNSSINPAEALSTVSGVSDIEIKEKMLQLFVDLAVELGHTETLKAKVSEALGDLLLQTFLNGHPITFDIVIKLLDIGADPNYEAPEQSWYQYHRSCPFLLAVAATWPIAVKEFIKRGVDMPKYGGEALRILSSSKDLNNKLELGSILISHGADVHYRDRLEDGTEMSIGTKILFFELLRIQEQWPPQEHYDDRLGMAWYRLWRQHSQDPVVDIRPCLPTPDALRYSRQVQRRRLQAILTYAEEETMVVDQDDLEIAIATLSDHDEEVWSAYRKEMRVRMRMPPLPPLPSESDPYPIQDLDTENEALKWVVTEGNSIPPNAIRGGHESDGTPLYIVRAYYENGIHPGKVSPHFTDGAHISWGGKEVAVSKYEILVGDESAVRWVDMQGRSIAAPYKRHIPRIAQSLTFYTPRRYQYFCSKDMRTVRG